MKHLTYLIVGFTLALMACQSDSGADVSPTANNPGATAQVGSLSRFTIANNHLYTLSGNSIITYSIADIANPVQVDSVLISANSIIETIFSKDSLLFFGANNGMFIYKLNGDFKPNYVSRYEHVVACDPVVADDKFAYVTLNSRSLRCGRFVNQLMILNLSNINKPELIKTIPMPSPKGLGLFGSSRLIVCNNTLDVYDLIKPPANDLSKFDVRHIHSSLIRANDVIPVANTNRFIVTADGGIYQYELNDTTFTLLSKIPVLQ